MNIIRSRAIRVGLALLLIMAFIVPFAQYFWDGQDCCEDACCDDLCGADVRDCNCHGLTVAGIPDYQTPAMDGAACGLVVRPPDENSSALIPDDTDHPPRHVS